MSVLLKLGGELLEDAAAMKLAAAAVARIAAQGPIAVVHGGGRAIDADLKARGQAPSFVDGLRVTDAETLNTVVSVLAGRINPAFVAALVTAGVKAVGLTGADAGIGLSSLAPPLHTTAGTVADLGLVGVPRADAPAGLLTDLLERGYVPVIASIGVGYKHIAPNTVAVTIYAMAATAVLSSYAIRFNHPLYLAFERLMTKLGRPSAASDSGDGSHRAHRPSP